MSSNQPSLYAPRYWPAWLGIAAMRLCAMLPYAAIRWLGALIGRIYLKLGHRHRQVAQTNLARCFPEKDADWQAATLKAHFESMGISLLEAPLGWWGNTGKIAKLSHVQGLEHLTSAIGQGKGVILFFAHALCPEMIGRIIAQYTPLEAMYRPSNHPVMELVITSQRQRHLGAVIPKSDVKTMIRRLRLGKVISYLADQNASRKDGVFVDFFGIPASTIPATARLAKLTGAAVVPLQAIRRDDGQGYDVRLYPALDNFPSDDLVADTQRTISLVEDWVREAPAQYYWLHRRFKTRPTDEEPPFYS